MFRSPSTVPPRVAPHQVHYSTPTTASTIADHKIAGCSKANGTLLTSNGQGSGVADGTATRPVRRMILYGQSEANNYKQVTGT